LSFAQAARIGALTVVLTLGGVILLWAQRRLAGSLLVGMPSSSNNITDQLLC
jgi:hypothetical protein